MSDSALCFARHGSKGAALIVVLAFVVLLTSLVLAYFTRAGTDRQLAQASSIDIAVDLLARSALDIVVSDFKQEIVSGSSSMTVNGSTYFTPIVNTNYVIPMRSGNPVFAGNQTNDPIPNLIRRSFNNGLTPPDPIPPPGVPSRASAINSTVSSLNERSVSLARWNKHYLIPKNDLTDSTSDSTPVNTFVAPDWVIVTRNGPIVFSGWNSALADATATNSNYALGRYAYAVYDEGGLLDVNSAGYPVSGATGPSTTEIGRKGVVAFADLTALPTTPGNTLSNVAVNTIVGFRNYVTTAQTTTTMSYSVTAAGVSSFVNYFLGNLRIGTRQDFGTVNETGSGSGASRRTDQHFMTRSQLLAFQRNTGIGSVNTLQYLGTFSRGLNVPSFVPPAITIAPTVRYYIGNLNVLSPDPPGASTNTIRRLFGLRWQNGNPGQGTPGRWRYQGPTNPTALNHIPAISGTDIDFFQALNFALNGISGDDSTHIATTLAIGASIIDQYDDATVADPTSGSTTTQIEFATDTAYGMENGDTARPVAAPIPPVSGYYMLNRPFRNVGEFGYAYNSVAGSTLNFRAPYDANSNADPAILDLFTYNDTNPNAVANPKQSGGVNLNTRQPTVLAALLRRSISVDATSSTVNLPTATTAANSIVNATAVSPGAARGRQDIGRLANVVGSTIGSSEEQQETVARTLAEVGQARTWGLFIDLVAQSGRYPPGSDNLADFVVEGERRYWLHIAIDRFTGQVIDQQLEAVFD